MQPMDLGNEENKDDSNRFNVDRHQFMSLKKDLIRENQSFREKHHPNNDIKLGFGTYENRSPNHILL